MISARWAGLAAGAGVAVVVGGATLIGPPGSIVDDHPEVREPVVRSSLVCPYVDGEDAGSAELGVLALPGVDAGETAEGAEQPPITVRALALPPDPENPEATGDPAAEAAAEPLVSIAERGVPTITPVETAAGTSYAVTGQGALAPGLAAEQSLLLQEVDLRGVSTAACTAPRREHWFVGASAEVGRRGRLILSNPTDVPAVVDVELWDEAGVIDAPGTQDVGVPARSQRIMLLDALAAGSVTTAVHVQSSQGRVTAALEVRETEEITPQGMTYVPAAVAPRRDLWIPGVPGSGQRSLRIVAPGSTDAIVSLQVLGVDGAYSPVDQDVVTVPAGTVTDIPLDSGADPAGIRLQSDEPITGSIRVVQATDGGGPDVAYTSASEPLTGPTPALLSRAASGIASTLLLSSTVQSTARVTVQTLAADGTVAAETPMELPPGATVPVPLTAVGDAANATVVVVPEAPGSVVAARQISGADDDGALLDLMPLISPTIEVDVPEVVGELPDVPEPVQSP
ncbi:DUF5719 family protein [Jiangella sp. DSM 45060]|uniref:DUF5719 family protein n=1 Tax=Jiangella sp. DSM 45060 TaxID=1798224 RepID=UPI000879EA45|nr:DUF5719 family protein [Jiangella sp. DSM 45060]SDS16133.1 hypothetical protein SAMN04515669_0467 [Jiangella sp. DSM 45060]